MIDKLCATLKIKEQPVQMQTNCDGQQSVPYPDVRQRRLRVLVVDDNEPNRQIARAMLKNDGYQPQLAEGGHQAIGLVQQQAFDLVLMDVCMPGIDGIETARRIRCLEQGANLSIIGLTAGFSGQGEDESEAEGMDAVLFKPIDWDELLVILDELDEVAVSNLSVSEDCSDSTSDIEPGVPLAAKGSRMELSA